MLAFDVETISLVMEHSPNLIFVKDDQCRIIFGNKAFMEIFPPESRSSIIGRTMVESFSDAEAEAFLKEDRRALSEGSSDLVEEIVSYTGARKTFQTRKVGFTTSSGERRLLGMCNDITELASREAALVELNARLQSFSEMAAHDLRSPLASIVSALSLIKNDHTSFLSEKAVHFIDLMTESAFNLASNVTALLTASKASQKGRSLSVCETDLNLILAEVKFNLADAVERHGVLIYANRLPIAAVEPNLIRQLLQNLIENSIKYRSNDRQSIITIRYEENADRHCFSIEDNGVGIGMKAASKAFELYEQDTVHGVQGAGIGLALCKRVLSLHGGRISIDPRFEEGCRVIFDFPRSIVDMQDNLRTA